MICASRVTDFRIDKIEKTHIPLIKHPRSFRTTLVQIVNDAYNAFMKAHINMEKIELQVAQVPGYVKDCVKIIKSDNKVAIDKFVPRRLECIKKAADNGEKLSKEVSEAFDLLGELIQQVLLAITASQGAKEKEIEKLIKANITEKKIRQKQELERQKKYLKKEEEDAQKLLSKGQEYMMEEHKRSRGLGEKIFFRGEKQGKIEGFERTAKYAEERLKRAKQDRVEAEKEMKKITDECTTSLANMQIVVQKDISTDEMIQILKKGTEKLNQMQKNWAGMTLYFHSINTYIEDMKTKQNLFVEDAKVVQDSSLLDLMAESIKNSLDSSIKSHRTAATYVKVSNNYIMEPLRNMHGMLALGPAEIPKAQEELVKSCKRASEGIKDMFNEDSAHTIRELENALQSLDPCQ